MGERWVVIIAPQIAPGSMDGDLVQRKVLRTVVMAQYGHEYFRQAVAFGAGDGQRVASLHL